MLKTIAAAIALILLPIHESRQERPRAERDVQYAGVSLIGLAIKGHAVLKDCVNQLMVLGRFQNVGMYFIGVGACI